MKYSKKIDYISKHLNIESLFPNDNTKPNIGEILLSVIIILSVITLILETEKTIYQNYQLIFQTLDYLFFFLFSIEYVLRLIFCGKLKKYRGFKGKFKYLIKDGGKYS